MVEEFENDEALTEMMEEFEKSPRSRAAAWAAVRARGGGEVDNESLNKMMEEWEEWEDTKITWKV